ncbi:TolB family protein [Kitasatospora sp. NPDC057692]|uniref:TolB family protein n=1 Tax=Kitasatospora sp. NPDC057692 TaxID=3346215 RepID=UPI00367CFB29
MPTPHHTRLRSTAVAGAAAAVLGATAVGPAAAQPAAAPPRVERISQAPGGAQADGDSHLGGLSATGRYTVFTSDAANLVPGDTNGTSDVFVRDLLTGRTERVSVADGGDQATGSSSGKAISADGRYVAFASDAADLAPGDANGTYDVYVRDRVAGRTERITVGDPAQPQTGGTDTPVISWDGRYVAFASGRGDLVPGDTNHVADVFVHDRRTGTTRRANVADDGTQAESPARHPALSADGGAVSFVSRDSLSPGGGTEDGGTEDGGTEDGDGTGAPLARARTYPLYVHDLRTGRTRPASIGPDGATYGVLDGGLSPDGRYALFSSYTSMVSGYAHPQVFVHDLRTGTTTLVSTARDGAPGAGDGQSYSPVMTADNRRVYFASNAANLVAGDTNGAADVFRRDLWTGTVERVTLSPDGTQSPVESDGPAIDALGTSVLIASADGALLPGDTNQHQDVFLRRLPLF